MPEPHAAARRSPRSLAELEATLAERTDYELQEPPAGGWTLDRMRSLLAALGHPERAFRAIHVAGTAGKGSVACALASTLDAAGLRVGWTTSPHLVSFAERVRLGARPANEALWVEAAAPVLAAAATLAEPPTYFEIVTAIAFELFRRARVDAAVVEAGLGGRLDATNTLPAPALCVLTRIARDHTALLGEDLASIAREKAGIVKAGVPVVAAPGSPEAEAVVRAACRDRGAPLSLLGHDASLELLPPSPSAAWPPPLRTRVATPWGEHLLEAPLAQGAADNLALVALAAHRLEEPLGRSLAPYLPQACRRLRWRGRHDLVPGQPPVFVDGAHEPASLAALVDTCRRRAGPPPTLLFALARDKDLAAAIRLLEPLRGTLQACPALGARGRTPVEIAARFAAAGWEASPAPSVAAGLEAARRSALRRGSYVLVTGSLRLAGAALSLLGEDAAPAWD
ncbi:MAG: bifunctional folylpolyglutamate synthase/dihydrofolate synthase [Planctomycetota bacterium]|nr:MAG: bifunctional folylpolyglutamate synthase/dihydrofolate synthase [Planctomycetota bacterium]